MYVAEDFLKNEIKKKLCKFAIGNFTIIVITVKLYLAKILKNKNFKLFFLIIFSITKWNE